MALPGICRGGCFFAGSRGSAGKIWMCKPGIGAGTRFRRMWKGQVNLMDGGFAEKNTFQRLDFVI